MGWKVGVSCYILLVFVILPHISNRSHCNSSFFSSKFLMIELVRWGEGWLNGAPFFNILAHTHTHTHYMQRAHVLHRKKIYKAYVTTHAIFSYIFFFSLVNRWMQQQQMEQWQWSSRNSNNNNISTFNISQVHTYKHFSIDISQHLIEDFLLFSRWYIFCLVLLFCTYFFLYIYAKISYCQCDQYCNALTECVKLGIIIFKLWCPF